MNMLGPEGGSFRHGSTLVNGEYAQSADAMYYPPSACPSGWYVCGAVLSHTYWELAWGVCRASFWYCNENDNIIQGGSYGGTQQWILANAAFSWAMQHLSGVEDPGTFMNLVFARYDDFLFTYGYIDSASYNRIAAVLAHHCVGWGNHCSDFKLPGSKLPAKYSTKKYFAEAEGSVSGGASILSGTNAASADKFSWLFYAPASSTSQSLSILTGETGNYLVKFIARQYISPGAVRYRLDTGAWSSAISTNAGAWTWYQGGIHSLSAGTAHTVTLDLVSGSVDVDAVVLVRQ
jgi:hypothetical protein